MGGGQEAMLGFGQGGDQGAGFGVNNMLLPNKTDPRQLMMAATMLSRMGQQRSQPVDPQAQFNPQVQGRINPQDIIANYLGQMQKMQMMRQFQADPKQYLQQMMGDTVQAGRAGNPLFQAMGM